MNNIQNYSRAIHELVFPPLQCSLTLETYGVDPSLIEEWLQSVAPEALQLSSKQSLELKCNQSLVCFISCFLATCLVLFKQAKIPIFELPLLVGVAPVSEKPEEFYVTVKIVNTGFFSVNTIKAALFGAAKFCYWLGSQRLQAGQLKTLPLQYLAEEILKGIQTSAGSVAARVLEAAHKKSIHYCHLGDGIARLGWGKNAMLIYQSMHQSDSYMGLKLSSHKLHAANVMRAAGLRVPVHQLVSTESRVFAAAKKLGFPLVLKPVDAERGEGVTIDIVDEVKLSQAFSYAQTYSKSKQVLVEKQVPGVCHRLFMVNSKLLYAVKRWPPSVFGDGRSTIKQLVELAYQTELEKLPADQKPLLPWDCETEEFIQSSGLTADYVPVLAERIALRKIESTKCGGFDEEVTHIVHADTLRQASIACRLLHLSVCGVDVITEDISLPLSQTGGVINELNGGPLLGGGEISRSYIPEYLRRLLPQNGQIPIAIFHSAESEKALEHFKDQVKSELQCYFTSEALTLDFQGHEMMEPDMTLAERLRILIFNPDVEALCIVSDALYKVTAGKQLVELTKEL